MDTTHTLYPLFSSDQVLSARHLNDLREHLDEQGRLTRANLTGVGIVCGLQAARPAPGTVTLSRGCGITSQGHLIVVDEDLALAHVRRYVLPDDLDYPALRRPAPDRTPYPLWELVPDDDVPGAGPLSEADLTLDEMALLLLRELRTGTGCGCGPGSCSHTGTDVTATVRPLLLRLEDLDEILETAAASEPTGDLGAEPAALLDLPDLRLPRVDVPATPLVESEDVLGAFQRAFGRTGLAEATADALSALYATLRPLLDEDHPTDPFTGFRDRFGFLDTGSGTARQLLFLPGYWDLFDDLLRQYEEIRTAADGLLARCCPPGETFPRHLMIGALSTMASTAGGTRARTTDEGVDAARYRHRFAPSPAVVGCRDRAGTVRDLFSRLVETIRCFTDQPSGEQVRLTPSRWGETPLGERAIPYYYELTGTPALHELWNPRLTARHRAHHNLGYRAEEFRPAAPAFVTDPLDYDLEPHDVLRVEGHLGSDVDDVLGTLLEQRQEHRLPFDVVALRTGELDPRMAVDLSGHEAVFQDLEMHYDTLRNQQICALVELVQRVYDLPWQRAFEPTPKAPQLWLLAHHAPEYLVQPGTVGWLLESRIVEGTSVFAADVPLFDIEPWQQQLIALLNRFSDYARTLTEDLHDLDPDAVAQEHSQLQELTEKTARHFRTGEVMEGLRDLAAQLERVGRSCRPKSVLDIHDEYLDRLAEVRRMQYLEAYLEQHPGIRHRSGVPLGGTLVLIYHEPPAPDPTKRVADALAEWTQANPVAWTDLVQAVGVDVLRDRKLRVHGGRSGGRVVVNGPMRGLDPDLFLSSPRARETTLGESEVRDATRAYLRKQPDQESSRLLDVVRGAGRRAELGDQPVDVIAGLGELVDDALARRRLPRRQPSLRKAVATLRPRTVIADFFLPYLTRSTAPVIQYGVPARTLTADIDLACTDSDGLAEATLTVPGATLPLTVRIDDGDALTTDGALSLHDGEHTLTLQDADGQAIAPVTLTVPGPLRLEGAEPVDDKPGTWYVELDVLGGTPPYRSSSGTVTDGRLLSESVLRGETLQLEVTDAAGCTAEGEYGSGHTPCDLPCEGETVREGFRFWIPQPVTGAPVNGYEAKVGHFHLTDPEGAQIDLTGQVQKIIGGAPKSLSVRTFAELVKKWRDQIGKVVADSVGSPDWFSFDYAPAPKGALHGALLIERLTCLGLSAEISVSYQQAGNQYERQLQYTATGTTVSGDDVDGTVTIPPFDVVDLNRCRPELEEVPRCSGTDQKVSIVWSGEPSTGVVLTPKLSGTDRVLAGVWEVPAGDPALSDAEKFEVAFNPDDKSPRWVRLTIYTDSGCEVSDSLDLDSVRR